MNDSMNLSCSLTHDELDQRRDRLAALVNDIENAEVAKSSAAKVAKDAIDKLSA